MRRRLTLLSGTLAVTAGLLWASPARAQTLIWEGGVDGNYETGGNYSGGVAPNNSGAETVQLSGSGTGAGIINIHSAANILGLQGNGYYYLSQVGTGSLTIGAGGIQFQGLEGQYPLFFIDVPIVLGADQAWNAGNEGYFYIDGGISGSHALTLQGRTYMVSDNAFSGGLTVTGTGSAYVGVPGALGAGAVDLQNGSTLTTYSQPVSLSNAFTLDGQVNLGSDDVSDVLTLDGSLTESGTTGTIALYGYSVVVVNGVLQGPAGTTVVIAGEGAQLPMSGGSQIVLADGLSNIQALTVDEAQVIFAPTTNATGSIASLSHSSLLVVNQGYLGLDGAFAQEGGSVSTFFTNFGPSLGSNIDGSIGFDTYADPGSPNTFGDPIDLTHFTSSTFLGLGSSTSAILTGTITPTANNEFRFGGGGGTLTVQSQLADGGMPTSLIMTAAPSPLTLVLQGAANYTGGTVSNGGVLIFDTPTLPGPGSISLNGGYVGLDVTTEVPLSTFIGLFSTAGYGVLGIDNASNLNTTIDMSGFNSDSSVFIGTATSATLGCDASIIPANHEYLFTGVKGGALTINTSLGDVSGTTGMTLGLTNPIEINGQTSSVTITGDNTYTGPTTINSGAVFVNSNTAFGTGCIVVPDIANTPIAPYLASYGGAPVTLANNIQLASIDSGAGLTVGNGEPSEGDNLVLTGTISDYMGAPGILGVDGPVTLAGTNSYSGGTVFTGFYNTPELFVTNSSSLGTGPLTVQVTGALNPVGGDVSVPNPIVINGGSTLYLNGAGGSSTLTLTGLISGGGGLAIEGDVDILGSVANTYSGSTLISQANVIVSNAGSLGTGSLTIANNSTLGYASGNPTILDLQGDSGSTIALVPGQTLTLDADAYGGSFQGSITGDSSNIVVKTDTGTQDLSGVSTYAGGTNVDAGILIASHTGALGTGPVSVSAGAQLSADSSTTLSMPITLSGNATLSGAGTFSPVAPISFTGGAQVMAGVPFSGEWISTLHFGTNVTFGPGGAYDFNVANAGGTAGTDYSTINIAGTLAITATSESKFAINLTSVSPGGGPGLANFNSTLFYSWTILTTNPSGITGFDPTVFSINTGAFQNSLGGGNLVLNSDGTNLVLDFTPVPEPSTWMLLATGFGALGLLAWRRRRSSGSASVPSGG